MRRRLFALAAVVLVAAAAALVWWLSRSTASPVGTEETASRPDFAPPVPAMATGPTKAPAPPDLQSLPSTRVEAGLPGGAASGWVLDEDDGAIPGAQLAFEGPGGLHLASTSEAGRFDFHPALPGDYELTALVASGHEPRVRAAEETELALTLSPGRRIEGLRLRLRTLKECSGQVVLDDGGVPESFVIESPGPSPRRSPIPFAEQEVAYGDAGTFRFLTADPHTFLAALAGSDVALMFQCVHGRARFLRGFEDARTGDGGVVEQIEGVVVGADGSPAEGISLSGFRTDGETGAEVGTEATSRVDGQFSMPVLPGVYALVARGRLGLVEGRLEGVKAGSTGIRVVLDPLTDVAVHARRRGTGEPVPGFEAELSPLSERDIADLRPRGYREQRFTADGTVTLREVPVGRYQVSVTAAGYRVPPEQEASFAAGRAAQLDFELDPDRDVKFRVRDGQTHLPIPGARGVLDRDFFRALVSGQRVFTADGRGEFVASGVGDTSTMDVDAPGYRSFRVQDATIRDLAVTVELSRLAPDGGQGVEYGGVGISWGWDDAVATVVPGSPAERAGIVPGDVFWKVNDQEVELSAAVLLIRGPVGVPVRLAFHRQDGGIFDEALIRERIVEQNQEE